MKHSLESLQARIKGSRLYFGEKSRTERLYIPYIQSPSGLKVSAWFEVVNDRLRPFVQVVSRGRNQDPNLQDQHHDFICQQFHELIHNCELERRKMPLSQRLADNVTPVHTGSLQHQAEALRFCCSMKVSALFADTGTGKSKVAIDLCVSRMEAEQINQVLIICPVATKENFRREIQKWAPHIPADRWLIVGHETVGSSDRTIFELLNYVNPQTQIIIDESHLIKNPLAKRSKRIKQICDQTSYKLVMTGTPISENIHNLYMQYAVLSESIINVSSWLKFEEKYMILGGRSGVEIIGHKNAEHLMGLLEPYTYQIDKSQCLDLPAVHETALTCELTPEQSYCYYQEKRQLLELIRRDFVKATDIFQTFTRMQQITSGYYLGESLPTNKHKLLSQLDLSQPHVFFCKYLFEVSELSKILGNEKCAIFTGATSKTRDADLLDFSRGNKLYFIATMQSGGTGLNGLQDVCANAVFFSNSFSYMQRKQSVGRLDRKGQKQPITITDLMTNCGMDIRIKQVLNGKGNLADEIKRLLNDRTKLKQYVETL